MQDQLYNFLWLDCVYVFMQSTNQLKIDKNGPASKLMFKVIISKLFDQIHYFCLVTTGKH